MLGHGEPFTVHGAVHHGQAAETVRYDDFLQRHFLDQPDLVPGSAQALDALAQALGKALFGDGTHILAGARVFERMLLVTGHLPVHIQAPAGGQHHIAESLLGHGLLDATIEMRAAGNILQAIEGNTAGKTGFDQADIVAISALFECGYQRGGVTVAPYQR
ncbi:hypothetical protein PFLmoz3_01409 [Pseudomonas fluorescens]|uniref:Uncharacterized protein n=1 Tax=Pseudomonas fluorescens TaxID=294 RepID=A0A120G8A7_PSEFL|nr:hypothetical protein PFLmoz3_01409 [Pseudomonas fluorescens]